MCKTRRRFVNLFVLGTCILLLTGCETLNQAGLLSALSGDARRSASEETHRGDYQKTRSPEAMQWLLAHSVRTGMSLAEVGRVFGEAGVREYNDLPIKTNGGYYRSGDQVYRWGPDSRGHTAYLVFRDGRLVNFRASEFEEPLVTGL